ncbi:TlpA family protein disulfide reductase [Acaricomes phytoseiuli]|uniref:TlpA family protein disulfide reductase n=1 Tax=Acaricomes phytoseiuli TaxID=291968 RepID=UPI00036B81F5|nr:TlpA disulfide reductase family protein [Acaricomes phytoseiuli]
MGMYRRRTFLTGASLAAVAAVATLSGCTTDDPLADQARAGDNKNYIAGDGSVSEYAEGQRSEPLTFSGTLLDGTQVSAQGLRGEVAVLNFWYAACAPCREEAPDLEALYQEFKPQGVEFFGVNIRDEKATAESFIRSFNLTFPSFLDKDGAVLLSVASFVPPAAVPTTLVLDREGRVASRILGLAEKSTLRALIASAVGDGQPPASEPAAS